MATAKRYPFALPHAAGASGGEPGEDLAAACDALAHGDLVSGLAPPAALVVLGYGAGVEPARAYVARRGAALLVTWTVPSEAAGAAGMVEVEMVSRGSHVVQRSLQPDEALDALLAWLARVM